MNASPSLNLFSKSQLDVYKLLSNLKNPLLGQLYYTAISLSHEYNPEDEGALVTLLLLSHCVRELMNRFPDYIEGNTEAAASSQGTESRTLKVLNEAIAKEGDRLQTPPSNAEYALVPLPIAQALVSYKDALSEGSSNSMKRSSLAVLGYIEEGNSTAKAWNEIHNFFTAFAHIHTDGKGELPSSDQIQRKLSAVDNAIASRFGAYFDAKHSLERVLNRANNLVNNHYSAPEEEDITDALLLLSHPTLKHVFFSELKNPNWLAPLKKHQVFSSVPQMKPHLGAYVAWPEGQYLISISCCHPKEVTEILQSLQDYENPSYRSAVIEAATVLPIDNAADLSTVIKNWATEKYAPESYFWYDEHLITLIQRLILDGRRAYHKKGIKITHAVFSCIPSVDAYTTEADAISLVPSYFYEKQLEAALNPLTVKTRLGLLKGLLKSCCPASRHQIDSNLSHILLPRIDDVFQAGHEGPFYGIIRLLIANLNQLLSDDPGQFLQRVTDEHSVIRRICLYCLYKHLVAEDDCGRVAEPIQKCVSKALVSDDIYNVALRFEYFTLAKCAISKQILPVEQIEDLIVQSRAIMAESFLSASGSMDDRQVQDQARQHSICWQHRALSYIGIDLLSSKGKHLYDALTLQLGEERYSLEATSYQTVYGPNSPLTMEELEQMNIGDIFSYLESWHPNDEDFFALVTHDGLARIVETYVSNHANYFTGCCDRITHMRPIYQRAIVEGWNQAASKLRMIPIADLIIVAKHAADADEHVVLKTNGSPFDDDTTFRPLKCRCINALTSLLQSSLQVSEEQSIEILDCLLTLSQSSDPSADNESEAWKGSDPATVSFNTIRPLAITALGKWIERFPSSSRKDDALDAIQNCLPATAAATADAAAIGQIFPILAEHCPEWAKRHYWELFGKDVSNSNQQVLLTTVLALFTPDASLFDKLRSAISNTLEHEPNSFKLGFARDNTDSCTKLIGDWLYKLFITGFIEIDDPIILKWHSVAGPKELGFCLNKICRSVCGIERLDDNHRKRIESLWIVHKDELLARKGSESLDGIMGLVRSGHFDPEWWAAELLDCIKIGLRGISLRLIDGQLRSLSSVNPILALNILAEYAESASDSLSLVTIETAATILNNSRTSSSGTLSEKASSCMNRLGVLGYHTLDELIE